MKLANFAAAALMVCGAGLIGCQDTGKADNGDPMHQADNNVPTNTRNGPMPVGASGDAPGTNLTKSQEGRANQTAPNPQNFNGTATSGGGGTNTQSGNTIGTGK